MKLLKRCLVTFLSSNAEHHRRRTEPVRLYYFMETKFYINIIMNLPHGPECFGKFYIGTNAHRARTLFSELEGSPDPCDNNVLSVELIEISNGLPVNLKILSCSLIQLGENCKIITKELFKSFHLEGKL